MTDDNDIKKPEIELIDYDEYHEKARQQAIDEFNEEVNADPLKKLGVLNAVADLEQLRKIAKELINCKNKNKRKRLQASYDKLKEKVNVFFNSTLD